MGKREGIFNDNIASRRRTQEDYVPSTPDHGEDHVPSSTVTDAEDHEVKHDDRADQTDRLSS